MASDERGEMFCPIPGCDNTCNHAWDLSEEKPMTDRERDPVELARRFHETYERLAPDYGYETRKDTKDFDPQSANGRLMTAVCGEIVRDLARERDDALALLERMKEKEVPEHGCDCETLLVCAGCEVPDYIGHAPDCQLAALLDREGSE